MNIAKSYEFFKPETCDERIHIIGCGAIGSTVAENLVRYGLKNLTLYDFDTVCSHNIANQMYTEQDIGKLKVEALKEALLRINPEIEGSIRVVPDGYKNNRLSGYVFLCVDDIDLRRKIAETNKNNPFILGMFDFRMRLTDAQHFAADWHDRKMIDNFLASMDFTHEEAAKETPVSACNLTLSVCSTVRMIVSVGVSNFINFVKGEGIRKMILCDAFSYQLTAF